MEAAFEKALKILKQYWGFDQFRPHQEEVIRAVLNNQDTIALLPTGGGKSLCYQVPTLVNEGLCIVVSPLVALMKDQVEHLRNKGIKALYIHSGMTRHEIDATLTLATTNDYPFLYVSPERLKTDLFLRRVELMNVKLVAIDEAHCISQWGYDFRPPYLDIAEIKTYLKQFAPFIALTATATDKVVQDIADKLDLSNTHIVKQSFKRENIAYVSLHENDKNGKLLDALNKTKGSAIVYTRNRRQTVELAQFLNQHRIQADFYHAGLTPIERSKKQDLWIKGQSRVMVATNAFGMGIDKPDVRLVLHLDFPDQVENYIQEAGRAGRDGVKSFALLLYNKQDILNFKSRLADNWPEISFIKRVYQALCNAAKLPEGSGEGVLYEFDPVEFANNFGLNLVSAYQALNTLSNMGLIAQNEPLANPSKVLFLAEFSEIYQFQVMNPKYDKLIKGISRLYEGVYTVHQKVNEAWLGQKLNLTELEIKQMLKFLHKEGILEYLEQNKKPQVIFVVNRQPLDELSFKETKYVERKALAYENASYLINALTQTTQCRQQELLRYFNQEEPVCGICDVCLGRYTEPSAQEMELVDMQLELILQNSKSLNQITRHLGSISKESIIERLRTLKEEGFIEEKSDLEFKWIIAKTE